MVRRTTFGQEDQGQDTGVGTDENCFVVSVKSGNVCGAACVEDENNASLAMNDDLIEDDEYELGLLDDNERMHSDGNEILEDDDERVALAVERNGQKRRRPWTSSTAPRRP